MKKIIFFSKNLKIGGMEKALVLLLNNLVTKYEVKLVLEKKEGVLLKYLDQNIKIEEYQLSTSKNIVKRKLQNMCKRVIWSIKNKNQYDFSCNYATYSVIGSKLAQVSSKNSSIYVHSNYYEVYAHQKEQIMTFFKPHQLKKFSNIICVSKESKVGLEKIYPQLVQKIVTINNLFDYKSVIKSSKEDVRDLLIDKKNIYFVFVGRLENESKNLKLLLESFLEVSKIDSTYKLWVVGDGSYRDEMEKFIIDHKLNNTIFLFGEQENPYPYIKQSDCLILTSNYEGFPVVYLEALALNVPIMTTIAVSDDLLDIHDYCILIKKEKKDVVQKIISFQKKKKHFQIDFNQFNQRRIEQLDQLINNKK